jgi:hypothetical protein
MKYKFQVRITRITCFAREAQPRFQLLFEVGAEEIWELLFELGGALISLAHDE